MRSIWFGLAVAAVAFVGPAIGESAYDGPLAAPDATAAPPASLESKRTASRTKAKAAKPHHHAAAKLPSPATDAALPEASPSTGQRASAASAPPAEDPLSLGMKWNGSNDTAAQTRVQNYNGNAVGTGAEVGLKLHF